MTVVVGGVGSVVGTVCSAVGIGTSDQVLQQVTGSPVSGKMWCSSVSSCFSNGNPVDCFPSAAAAWIDHFMQRKALNLEIWGVLAGALVVIVVLPCLNAFTADGSWLHVSNFTIYHLWQIPLLCDAGHQRGFALGLYGFVESRPGAVFLAGRVYDGHVSHADDRRSGPISPADSGLPGVSGLEHAAGVLETFRQFSVCDAHGRLVTRHAARESSAIWPFARGFAGVYFSILTQALTYAACLLFFRNSLLLGGNNGFTDFKFILGHDLREPATQRGFVSRSGIALLAGLSALQMAHRHEVRQDPARHPRQRKPRAVFGLLHRQFQTLRVRPGLTDCLLSPACFMSPRSGLSTPAKWRPDKSLEAVVWVAVGGRGTLDWARSSGRWAVNAMKSWATRAYPDLVADVSRHVVHFRHLLHAQGHRRPPRPVAGNWPIKSAAVQPPNRRAPERLAPGEDIQPAKPE